MTRQETKKIQGYLRQVRRHIGDRSKNEQVELLRALEEQVYESINDSPQEGVEQILARMDPPESFEESEQSMPARNRAVLGRMSLGQLSLLILVVAVITPFTLVALSQLIRGTIGSIFNIGALLGVVLLIVALALGIAARKERAGKATIIASVVIFALLTVFIPVNRVVSGRDEPDEQVHSTETN